MFVIGSQKMEEIHVYTSEDRKQMKQLSFHAYSAKILVLEF